MPLDRTETEERLARIEEMIEQHRAMKHRQFLQRALKRWRRTEAHQRLSAFDVPPERIH